MDYARGKANAGRGEQRAVWIVKWSTRSASTKRKSFAIDLTSEFVCCFTDLNKQRHKREDVLIGCI